MERAVWAVWYDLREGSSPEYLDWMHGEYLPWLKQRPGVAWVAHYENATSAHLRDTVHRILARPAAGETGLGCQYIQLVGASDPLLLLSSSVEQQEKLESGRNRSMLDQQRGVQSCILAELFRVNGPEVRLGPSGRTPAAAIQMGMLRLKSHHAKHALSSCYANNRLPAITSMPGTIGARVFSCISGWPDFAALYEFRSVEDRERSFEPQETEQAVRPLTDPTLHPIPIDQLIHAPGSPQAARRIWPLA